MTPEKRAALTAGGDRYYLVNYKGIGTIADPAFSQMEVFHSVSPTGSVLEIGCTTGFRLDKVQQAFGAQCAGLEASDSVVAEGAEKYPQIDIRQGIAPRDFN